MIHKWQNESLRAALGDLLDNTDTDPSTLNDIEDRIATRFRTSGVSVSATVLSRLRTGEIKTMSWQKLLAVGWFLDLDRMQMERLLRAAGHSGLQQLHRNRRAEHDELFERWPELVVEETAPQPVVTITAGPDDPAGAQPPHPADRGVENQRPMRIYVVAGAALVAVVAVAGLAFTVQDARTAGVEPPAAPSADTATTTDTIAAPAYQARFALASPEGLLALAYAPDGQEVAVGGLDAQITRWDAATGVQLGEALIGHDGSIRHLAYRPDSGQLASAGEDGTILVWDTASGRIIERIDGHAGPVNAVTYSPDGAQLASVGDDGTLWRWDATTGDAIAGPLSSDRGGTTALAYSPDGTELATGGHDLVIRIWDTAIGSSTASGATDATGRPIDDIEGGPIASLAYRPDGDQLSSASGDGFVRLHDGSETRILMGHVGPVASVAYSFHDVTLASVGADRVLRLWHSATGAPVGEPLAGHREPITAVAFSPTGPQLATVGADGVLGIWDEVDQTGGG